MPRIRTIKPEFWTDEKLSLLDATTRLVFLGLISHADDAGRLVDNTKLLDGLIFPNTDDTCEQALKTLARLSRISRYVSSSGQALIQIVRFSDHQKVDHPSKYVLPGPEGGLPSQPEMAQEDTTAFGKQSRKSREGVAKVSRSDLVSTTSTNDLLPTTRTTPTVDRKNPRSTPRESAAFAAAWAAYPKRSGSNPKRRAEIAWGARIAEGTASADLIAGVQRYAVFCRHEGKVGTPYVLQAATFFGPDRRWAESWELSSNGADHEASRVSRLVAEEEDALRSTAALIARRRGTPAGADT